ncbi:hypothetical protein N431DRAFT_558082 [Stipitochalara longipes BDJ]|nr:hypothetical protein N431DRAFT_558082 [Stipitochalara longipes BDJ]
MVFKKVALAGASGYLGRRILDHLLTIPTLSQLTILTHSSSVEFPSSPILTIVSVPSYQDVATLTVALQGHDLLISTLSRVGANDADEPLVLAAIAAGVRRYMPSEYTVDVMHPHAIAIAGSTVLAGKIASAQRLQKLAENGDIEYTTLVTGAFLDFWFEYPNPVILTKARTITLLDGGEKKMTGVTTSFVAKSIGAIVAMSQEATKNQRIRIAEVEYTGKALLHTLEEVTDTKWTVIDQSTDEIFKGGLKAGENGDVRGFYLGNIIKINFDGEGAGFFEEGMQWLDGAVERQNLKEIAERKFRSKRHVV